MLGGWRSWPRRWMTGVAASGSVRRSAAPARPANATRSRSRRMKKDRSEAVSRILSAFDRLRERRRDDHSSSLAIADEIERPTREPSTGRHDSTGCEPDEDAPL